MDSKLDQIAISIGSDPDVAERLDKVLQNPRDRAWIICSFRDCVNNIKGECTIYTVASPPAREPGKPCSSFEKRM
ncbi:MAG: hypothetical protein HYS23_15285 [Geobacter sp.]|nr:hypothetical protein [Geobacter sp.]